MIRCSTRFAMVVLALLGSASASAEPSFVASSVASLKSTLAKQLTARDISASLATVNELASMDDKKAIDAVCGLVFSVDVPDVERGTIRILRELPRESESIARVAHLCTKHKDSRVRSALVWVMEPRPETACRAAIVQCLYDRMPSVTLAALEVMIKWDSLAPVQHLVDALKYQEEQGRNKGLVAFEIRKTLTALTNKNFDYADDWNNFWKVRKSDFVRPPKQERTAEATGVKRSPPTFFGMEVNTDRFVFILDVSGSMKIKDPFPEEQGNPDKDRGGTGVGAKKKPKKPSQDDIPEERRRLSRVQKELITVINKLPSSTRFNIVSFNHQVGTWEKNLVTASPRNKQKAIAYVKGFKAEGETYTDEALDAAFAIEQIDSIFLLSDGAPKRNGKLMNTTPILEKLRNVNRFRRVRINAVTFMQCGSNLRRFMKRISSQNNGVYKELR